MSLKDTIRGAREEASAAGNPFERKGTDDAVTTEGEDAARPRQGRARSSAASRKPTRQAAAGVRVVSGSGSGKGKKPRSEMTKEEKKAERQAERDKEDRRYTATQMLLEDNEEYLRARKVWRTSLMVGVVFMAAALVTYVSVTNMGAGAPAWMGLSSLVLMVISYVILIFGLIYDYRKIKPLREVADQRVASMSEKKVKTLINNK